MEEAETTIETHQEDPDVNCGSTLTTEVILEKIPDEDNDLSGKPPTYDDVKFTQAPDPESLIEQLPPSDNDESKNLENGKLLLAPYPSKPQSESQPSQETLQNQETSCGVDCMYYTLMCCECSIM